MPIMEPLNKEKAQKAEMVVVLDDKRIEDMRRRLANGEWRGSIPKQRIYSFGDKGFRKALTGYIRQPVAVWAVRYVYRGILERVYSDCLVLDKARAVELTGPSCGRRPKAEDRIHSKMLIPLTAIEQVCQPNWAGFQLVDEPRNRGKHQVVMRGKSGEQVFGPFEDVHLSDGDVYAYLKDVYVFIAKSVKNGWIDESGIFWSGMSITKIK